MLMILDEKQKAQDYYDNLRAISVAVHPETAPLHFPQWFKDKPQLAKQTEEVNEENIEWSVPRSEAEHLEIENWIASKTSGVVTGAELLEGGWM